MTGVHKVGVPAPRTGTMVGGAPRAPRGELAICCLVAAVSLAVAAAFHRLAPGFGIVFKPLLWPLLVLPFAVRPRYALVTSFAVPLLSCALTGMPSLPVALALSGMAAVVTTALALGMAVIRHNRLAYNRDSVVLSACRGVCSSVNCTETSSSSTMAHFAEMRPREWRHD